MDPQYVRLLDVAPALGDGLAGRDLREARRLAVAPLVTLPAGRWDAAELERRYAGGRVFGCLVVDGLIAHHLALAGRSATYLVGRGDVIAPGARPSATLATRRLFGVADDTGLALLDESLPALARRWPSIAGQLLVQAEHQLARAAVQQIISQLPRADQRIVAILWHLAERWGRTEPDGVVVPLTLGHEAISQLAGGRRPTVSAALGELAERGLVARLSNGTWWLAPGSKALLAGSSEPALAPPVRLLGRSSGPLVPPALL